MEDGAWTAADVVALLEGIHAIQNSILRVETVFSEAFGIEPPTILTETVTAIEREGMHEQLEELRSSAAALRAANTKLTAELAAHQSGFPMAGCKCNSCITKRMGRSDGPVPAEG